MARRNEKYTPEMREQTAAYILESGKSATKTAKEMGIDVNTVCRWVQDYRKKHNLPSYAEEKGIKRSMRILKRKLMQARCRINPSVTQAELASVMNISRRSIQLLMKELTERGVIERVGSKKVGSWIVKQ